MSRPSCACLAGLQAVAISALCLAYVSVLGPSPLSARVDACLLARGDSDGSLFEAMAFRVPAVHQGLEQNDVACIGGTCY